MYSKQIINLNIKGKIAKLLEESLIEKSTKNLGLVIRF
jgi:hypothetical protein